MRPLRLSEIAAWCGGELLGEDRTITAIGNDSRTAAAGSLYVALPGERFDGHAFCADAAAAGASGLLVARPVASDLPQVCCADTTRALADIATALARTRTGRIAAVTGSNGKTTVKTLIAAILECAAPGRSHANPGNRNNEIGLPLAVIAAPEDARYSVYEMGAGKPGDIAYLAAIVQPSVALVNNIGPAHLERLGSLLGVAETKGAIHAALAADGVAVINADDAFAPWFRQRIGTRVRVLDFGLDGNAEVRAEAVRPDAGGWRFRLRLADAVAEAHLAMPGRHNLGNALAAAAVGHAFGFAIETVVAGLAAAQAVPGRQAVHRLSDRLCLIDDSYNANPGSVAAAIEVLRGWRDGPQSVAGSRSPHRWLVLGDMAELGPDGPALHAAIGQRARAAGLDRVFTVGRLSAEVSRAFGDGAAHFDRPEALTEALTAALAELDGPVVMLVKGSRSAGMERVVAAVVNRNRTGSDREAEHAS